MPDPVLRIPVDDSAFKRYLEMFQRYQEQLGEQPEMWQHANEATRDGVAANLALADAIGQSVSAAIRLGDVQDRNAAKRKREREAEHANEQRAASWRRKALDHVQELSRTADSVVRSFGSFASGARGTGGLFGMIADGGKGLGGDLGALVSLAGHALNAGYEINSAIRDKGQFARGIGTSISAQEGFHNNLGSFTNTDQGIDAVMNARNDPRQWGSFATLGVDWRKGSNAELYADVLRKQTRLAKSHLDENGNIKFYETDPRGGSAFGTTHEDLNRLVKAPNLEKAIQEALSFKSPLGDKQTDAATKTVAAMDTLTTKTVDAAQAMTVSFNPALDKATQGLTKIGQIAEKIASHFPSSWFGGGDTDTSGANSFRVGRTDGYKSDADAAWAKRHPWLARIGFHIDGGKDTSPDTYNPHALDQVTAGVNTKAAAGGRAMSRYPAGSSLGKAFEALTSAGGRVTSGVRTRAEQQRLYDEWRANPGAKPRGYVVARPGFSEHENGNAIDVVGMTRKAVDEALTRAGVKHGKIIDEGNHIHVSLSANSSGGSPQRGRSGNVNVVVKTTALAGHQTAVSVNSAAKGQ